MTTEQAIELLSASIDRSLTPAEQSALDAWLAADPEHRILADGLRHQHADLRTTFEPRRCVETLTLAPVALGSTPWHTAFSTNGCKSNGGKRAACAAPCHWRVRVARG